MKTTHRPFIGINMLTNIEEVFWSTRKRDDIDTHHCVAGPFKTAVGAKWALANPSKWGKVKQAERLARMPEPQYAFSDA